MIVWGKNRYARPLPYDCVPFKTVRRNGLLIKKPLTWHSDWCGWRVGRLANNTIDEQLKALESKYEA